MSIGFSNISTAEIIMGFSGVSIRSQDRSTDDMGARCGDIPPPHVSASGVALAYDSLLLPLPDALFFGRTLVEQLLAFYQSDLALYFIAFPVQCQRDAGVSGLADLAHNSGNLLGVQQQFSGARRVGNYMGGSGKIGRAHV